MTPKKKKKGLGSNTLLHQTLCIFANKPFSSFNYKQLSARLGIKDKASKNLVKLIVQDLLKSENIEELKPGKYRLNPNNIHPDFTRKSIVTGTVDMKKTGKAYIITDDDMEDVFINAANTNRALNGDHVKVQLFPKRKGRKTEGEIIEIIKRKTHKFVGTIQISKHFAFLIADEESMPIDVFISKDKLNGAENGDKVFIEITDWPERAKNPFGKIVEILGRPGDNDVEMMSILSNAGIKTHFPDAVIKEANNINQQITKEEIKKRRDFRNTLTITIDPFDAKDFDDAISIKKLTNKNWEIGVHIADVSHFVKPNSRLDKEAFERANSTYLVDRVIPMLPENLSNQLCSLRPKEDKLCFSAVFEIDNNAQVLNQWFGKTVINSDRRYNYKEAQEIIEGGGDKYAKEIITLNQIAKKFRKKRFLKGSINFHSQEVRFILNDEGEPLETYVKTPKDSNHLVEEYMLLANKKVAEKIGNTKNGKTPKTFIYRVHDEPPHEKLTAFSEFIAKFGYAINYNNRNTMAKSFNNLFSNISGKAEENLIETVALRTMAKAIYSTDNNGHYGLAFNYYSHFTSPIRRYADLMVHRLLEHYLKNGGSEDGNSLEKKCIHLSEQERKSVDAERMSVKYMQAKYLLDKVGESFFGVISGVSKWGIFVELKESKCEGMVSLKSLSNDYYFLDEENYKVIGRHTNKTYTLGDQVKIKIINIDLSKRQMDFELIP